MKSTLISATVALMLFLVPSQTFSVRIQDVFQRPYQDLLYEVAVQSSLFNNAAEVEQALLKQPENNQVDRLKKKIAAVRMLMLDGQIQSDEEVSSTMLILSSQRLVVVGEHLVMFIQTQKQTGVNMIKKTSEKQARPVEYRKNDYAFKLGSGDNEFNFFDIIALPFRLLLWILEKLFNIILYPFKLLAEIIF
jgi:hypothetical protein